MKILGLLKNIKIKKILLPALSVVLLGAIAIGGTYATLMDASKIVTNSFEPGSIRTEIVEDTSSYGKKDCYVVNTGKNDCLVRARVVVTPSDLVTIEYNTSDWEEGADGYWYYKDVLKAQGNAVNPYATPSLIKKYSVKGVDKNGKVEQGKEVPDFDITVSQESVQVEVSLSDGSQYSALKDGKYDYKNALKVWNAFSGTKTTN